jgi:enoyl-CoA hydratase/carnithine racemase
MTATSPEVFELVMSAPGKNALGIELMQSMLTQLEAAREKPVLLTGAGDAFSAGLNLKEVASLDRPGMQQFLETLERLIERLYLHPAPVVAWVNGHAIAGGCVLTLCADHRVAVDDPAVRIGLNEVALGLQYPPRLFNVVRRRVAPRALERVVLEAGLYPPRTALELGLIDEVATDAGTLARSRLATLAAHPREAFAVTKQALRGTALPVSAEDERRFRDELVPAWCAPAVKERVTALLRRGR